MTGVDVSGFVPVALVVSAEAFTVVILAGAGYLV
jgi:hypothetical protein